jgi:hypothetical protein
LEENILKDIKAIKQNIPKKNKNKNFLFLLAFLTLLIIESKFLRFSFSVVKISTLLVIEQSC